MKPSGIVSVDNIWDHVAADGFIAVSLEGYKNVPVIGKVLAKQKDAVRIHYWRGSWNKKWQPWFHANGEPWTDLLPKECIQGVSKKSRQFRNGSQPREAASSMKFFVNIDCLGTCDVE